MPDTKITVLTELATGPDGDELLAIIDDPGGTPTPKRITVDNLLLATPAASDTVPGIIEIAIQSEQETATDVVRAVTPGRQHFHPSAAKFWVKWTANSTTILASYNVASIADTAVGDADVTIATDFSSAEYVAFVEGIETSGFSTSTIYSAGINSMAAGVLGCMFGNMIDGGTAAGGLFDPDQWTAIGFGDHA